MNPIETKLCPNNTAWYIMCNTDKCSNDCGQKLGLKICDLVFQMCQDYPMLLNDNDGSDVIT